MEYKWKVWTTEFISESTFKANNKTDAEPTMFICVVFHKAKAEKIVLSFNSLRKAWIWIAYESNYERSAKNKQKTEKKFKVSLYAEYLCILTKIE